MGKKIKDQGGGEEIKGRATVYTPENKPIGRKCSSISCVGEWEVPVCLDFRTYRADVRSASSHFRPEMLFSWLESYFFSYLFFFRYCPFSNSCLMLGLSCCFPMPLAVDFRSHVFCLLIITLGLCPILSFC